MGTLLGLCQHLSLASCRGVLHGQIGATGMRSQRFNE